MHKTRSMQSYKNLPGITPIQPKYDNDYDSKSSINQFDYTGSNEIKKPAPNNRYLTRVAAKSKKLKKIEESDDSDYDLNKRKKVVVQMIDHFFK